MATATDVDFSQARQDLWDAVREWSAKHSDQFRIEVALAPQDPADDVPLIDRTDERFEFVAASAV